MTNSDKLKKHIDSFYREWIPDVEYEKLSPTEHAVLVDNHQKLIDRLEPFLVSKLVRHPQHGQKCFGVEDLHSIGKNKFVDDYFYNTLMGKFVKNISDSDPYGYVDKWVSFDVIDGMSEEEFEKIINSSK